MPAVVSEDEGGAVSRHWRREMRTVAKRGVPRARAPASGGPAGFTLLEIVLVLVLIGLIGAVITGSVVRVVDADHPSPEDVFWQACRSAEKLAALSDHTVTLTFDEKTRQMVWSNGAETDQAGFDPKSGEVSVQFLRPRSADSRILLGGQVVETATVPAVTFYPDGTCTAFQVQFRVGAHARRIAVDPWTCAPMLEKKKEAGS